MLRCVALTGAAMCCTVLCCAVLCFCSAVFFCGLRIHGCFDCPLAVGVVGSLDRSLDI